MLFKNLRLYTFLALGCISISTTSCKNENKKVTQAEITFKKEGKLIVYKSNSDSIRTSFDIEIADNDYETQTGLMYRNSMKANQGMLFIFDYTVERFFYMKNTKIPLDLIFINDNKKIVSFQTDAKPFDETSLTSNVPAKYVLEVNAGSVKKLSVAVGDSISYSK